ncbi:TPA: glycosyltransferase family 1 protein [Candidatus Poribacteria bacterium]|nr:glycosyltransferase family 1 protein [Candidatus Poribacteria bacterium]
MINILYFAHTGKHIGGGETQLFGLLKNLNKDMFSPIVICPNSGEFSDLLKTLNIPILICHLPGWRKLISFKDLASLRLLKTISKYQIDLVHASDFWYNYYALQIGKLLGVPTITHVRNIIIPNNTHKYLFDHFNKVIAISERIKNNLIDGGISPEKVEYIADGVDLTEFQPNRNKINVLRRDFRLRDKLIGLVGRIEPFKRQKDFMSIAAEVVKRRKDVSFLLIGDTLKRYDKYLRETISVVRKYGIYKYVVWTGYRRDMPDILNSLDILVTLSGGSVTMEARACETPVIMSDKAKQINLICDDGTGILNVPDNISDLSEAILRLLDDDQLRTKIGKSGRKRVENFYDMRKTSEDTQKIYKDLLGIND